MQSEQCQCKFYQVFFSNFANLHSFSLTNVSDFDIEYVKFDTFFYFALIDANALKTTTQHNQSSKQQIHMY